MSIRLFTFLCFLSSLYTNIAQAQFDFDVTGADSPGLTPIQLIEDICLGPGIEVLGIEYQGDPMAVGSFSGGEAYFGIEEGFVMTTGAASSENFTVGVDQPSNVIASISNNSPLNYYPKLVGLANSFEMSDIAVYTIRFRPLGDSIRFRYVFASDEYPLFVCSDYNDAFGFFLEGPDANGEIVSRNLAKVPGTDFPVSINSVNGGMPGFHASVDASYCTEANNGSLDFAEFFNYTPPFNYPVQDGYTDIFVAEASVIPCQEYTMELAIADFGDAFYDSALFFEAESFCSPTADTNIVAVDTLPIILEGCAPPGINLNLEFFPSYEYPLTYTVSGTATGGEDYFGLNPFGVINDSIANWSLFLPVLNEGIAEGIETIVIQVEGSTCLQKTFILPIADPLIIEPVGSTVCSVEPITLVATGIDEILENFDFLWGTGDTTTTTEVMPTSDPQLITLEYTNELGTCTAVYFLEVSDPEADITLELCTNEDGIEINGTVYNFFNMQGTEVLEGASVAGCDSIVHIQVVPEVFDLYDPVICINDFVIINGTQYDRNNPAGLEVLSGAAVNGCDSVLRVNLEFAETSMDELRVELCENEAIVVNGTVYDKENREGIEVFEGGAANGCDSILEVSVDLLPISVTDLNVTIPEGTTYSVGSEVFEASGFYPIEYTGVNGCDSIINLRLIVQPISSTLTDSIAIGQQESLCVETNIFQTVTSFSNACPQAVSGTDFSLDAVDACLDYTGIYESVDTACLVACDEFGICDTTYLIVSVFENLMAAVDDYDTTFYEDPITIDVLANDWTSETIIDTQYLVDLPIYGTATLNTDGSVLYTPQLNACLQTDILTYAICNSTGCDTAQVHIYLQDTIGNCSGVWPGDVNNDGIVNQIDHWAIGLAYGNNGPVRPNASFEWIAQPAIDWNGTFTFITEINLKYADCNGNGQINTDDVGPIYANWGLTHLLPSSYQFPEKNIAFESMLQTNDEWMIYDLKLGTSQSLVADAYGVSFVVKFDPAWVTEIQFVPEGSFLGMIGEDLLVLEKVDMENGIAHVSLVRNDQEGITNHGQIGQLQLKCFDGACGELMIEQLQFLQSDGDVYNLPGNYNLASDVVSSNTNLAGTELRIFPNPVKDRLHVFSPQEGNYQLMDTNGKVLQLGGITEGNNNLNLSRLSAGLYILQVQIEDQLFLEKIIVQ